MVTRIMLAPFEENQQMVLVCLRILPLSSSRESPVDPFSLATLSLRWL